MEECLWEIKLLLWECEPLINLVNLQCMVFYNYVMSPLIYLYLKGTRLQCHVNLWIVSAASIVTIVNTLLTRGTLWP